MSIDQPDPHAPRNNESNLQDHAVRGAVLHFKRDAIIGVASGCFFQRGYTNTSLEYIAKQLNLSSKALYYYFPNKKELFLDVLSTSLDRTGRIIEQVEADGGTGMAKIRNYVSRVVQACAQKHGPQISDIPPQLQKLERAQKIRSEQIAQNTTLVRWVREGMEDGSTRRGDSVALWNMLLGILMWMPRWAHKEAGYDTAESVRLALEAVENILEPRH